MSINIINPKLQFKGTFTVNKPEAIIIHHALHNSCTIHDVHKWHLDKGWLGFGYHFFINKNGIIYKGREINQNGGHTQGMNTKSIGICLEGCYTDYKHMTEKTVPEVQIKSVIALTKYLMNWNNLRKIYPHSQFNQSKDCPGKYFPFGRFLADCFKIKQELTWEQIADKTLDSKDRWILGYQKALELKGEHKELEIFKILPDLFVKLYYTKSE